MALAWAEEASGVVTEEADGFDCILSCIRIDAGVILLFKASNKQDRFNTDSSTQMK